MAKFKELSEVFRKEVIDAESGKEIKNLSELLEVSRSLCKVVYKLNSYQLGQDRLS